MEWGRWGGVAGSRAQGVLGCGKEGDQEGGGGVYPAGRRAQGTEFIASPVT